MNFNFHQTIGHNLSALRDIAYPHTIHPTIKCCIRFLFHARGAEPLSSAPPPISETTYTCDGMTRVTEMRYPKYQRTAIPNAMKMQ